jgi:hypothetical protein
MLRVLVDPVYALWLTTGERLLELPYGTGAGAPDATAAGLRGRFAAEQARVHRAATSRAVGPLPWPRLFGTPPWGAARFLNDLRSVIGVTYRWSPVDTTDPRDIEDRLNSVTAGLARGVPLPLYIGNHVDRHVVLAFGYDEGQLLVYDPSGAEVATVAPADIVVNHFGVAGWDRLEGVVVPNLDGTW